MAGNIGVKHIDPRQLRVPSTRITTEWTEEDLESFKADVKGFGIEQPLLVAKDGETYWIIDGKHRLDEALLNGLKTVPCIVREMSARTALMRNLASNHHRGKVKVTDEIRVIKSLMDDHSAGVEEIEAGTGLSRDRVETLMLIAQAHPDILRALDDERIKYGHAKELVRIPDKFGQSRMVYLVMQHGLTVEATRNVISQTIDIMQEQGTPQRSVLNPSAPAIPTVECHCCHNETPVKRAVQPVLCPMCWSSLVQATAIAEQEQANEARAAPANDEQSDKTPA